MTKQNSTISYQQGPFMPYYTLQAKPVYYGTYPYSTYTPMGPPYTSTGLQYTYTTPPRHFTLGGYKGTYTPGAPGIYDIAGQTPAAPAPILQSQSCPVIQEPPLRRPPMRSLLGNRPTGQKNNVPPRNMDPNFVEVRTINTGGKLIPPALGVRAWHSTAPRGLALQQRVAEMTNLARGITQRVNTRKGRERVETGPRRGTGASRSGER